MRNFRRDFWIAVSYVLLLVFNLLCLIQPNFDLQLLTLLVTRRLKSIKNIQKITKSMKMVSAAKYARAERELKPARVYGTGALGERRLLHYVVWK